MRYALLLLLLADLGYSFYQHSRTPLDGDVPPIVLAAYGYGKVMQDPFGVQILLGGESYPNPNRFFAHWTMSSYFKTVPFAFQRFTNPIDSVYLSSALIKTAIQLLLIWMLAAYASGSLNPWRKEFLWVALLIAPLFQTFGYHKSIGLVDQSVTYAIFYGLPLGLLLIFFYLYFLAAWHGQAFEKRGWTIPVLLSLLAVVLAFNGPVTPGIALTVSPLIILFGKKMPWRFIFPLIWLCLLSLYSLYIGLDNSEGAGANLSLAERYLRIPAGLGSMFGQKPGPPLLLAAIGLNALFLWRGPRDEERRRLLRLLKWVLIFSLIFIALLPLGGYREYRPLIVRRDTIMGVLAALFFFYGLSSYFLLFRFQTRFKKMAFAVFVAATLLVFTIADETRPGRWRCEREALQTLSQSREEIVALPRDCPVLAWGIIEDPKYSDMQSSLLEYWGVTEGRVWYFQE
jgi:hypothetical protein